MIERSSQLLILAAIICGSFIASLVLVRIGIKIARRVGFVNGFNSILNDSRKVALGGGVSFAIVIIVATLMLWHLDLMSMGVPFALIAVLLLGIADDKIRLSPSAKLAGELVAAAIYLSTSSLPMWAMPIGILLLISSQNAWNLVDVMDGLAGWITVTCFTGVAVLVVLAFGEVTGVTYAAVAAVGATAGFLVWNSHPARVFMGDAGSLLLGLLYGIFVLEVCTVDLILAVALLITGLIPIFETLQLIIERSRQGIPFYRPSCDHFSLRLQKSGRGAGWITRRVVSVGLGLSLLALIVVVAERRLLVLIHVLFAASIGGVVAYRYLRLLSVRHEVDGG